MNLENEEVVLSKMNKPSFPVPIQSFPLSSSIFLSVSSRAFNNAAAEMIAMHQESMKSGGQQGVVLERFIEIEDLAAAYPALDRGDAAVC